MRKVTLPVLAFATILLTSAAIGYAQTIEMTAIPKPPAVSEKIIGGDPVDPKAWPATRLFTSAAGKCTSTIVGQKAVITAAHCVGSGASAQVTVANTLIQLTCYDHPSYRGTSCAAASSAGELVGCTADMAMCVSNQPIPTEIGRFERIKSSPPATTAGANITILGYGCLVPGGPISPDLQIGTPKVEWNSQPGASANPEYTLHELIKTEGAGVCNGDSGGGVFSHADPATRELVALQSRGNLSTDSYLVSLTDPENRKFLIEFGKQHSVRICGLDQGAPNCR